MLHHVKKLSGGFSLSLFVDDVDNEPPVLFESYNISLSFSSGKARGIKCSVQYERTKKKNGRFLALLLNLHTAHFLSTSANCLHPIFFLISRLFSGSSGAEACNVFQ